MIREDLQPRADDEHHEHDVEQMLPPQPGWKAGMDCRRITCRGAGELFDERLHPFELPQVLRQRNSDHQSGEPQRNQPQRRKPAAADSHRRHPRLFLRKSARPFVDIDGPGSLVSQFALVNKRFERKFGVRLRRT